MARGMMELAGYTLLSLLRVRYPWKIWRMEPWNCCWEAEEGWSDVGFDWLRPHDAAIPSWYDGDG